MTMAKRPRSRNRTSGWWESPIVWVGGLALAAVFATVLLAGGSESDDEVVQTAPVELTGAALPQHEVPDPGLGLPVPTISGVSFDGEAITVGGDGAPRLYGFFAHWCRFCQQELPAVTAWLEENDLPDGLDIVAISTNVSDVADNYPPSAWFAREGWPDDVIVDDADSSLAQAFGLTGFPYWVVANADGDVVFRGTGNLTTPQFEALLQLASQA